MLTFLAIYQWPLLAGMVSAPALSLLGCHIAARDKSMQTMCVGQGATLGVLLGLGVLKFMEAPDFLIELGPFVTAALCSVLTFVIGERLVRNRQSSKNTYFSSLFASLLALGYMACALFPHLENHMTHVFFGDLATLTNLEAGISIALGTLTIIVVAGSWRTITSQSFNQAILGDTIFLKEEGLSDLTFQLLCLIVISFSIQFLGFLFTTACMFLPTTFGTRIATRGLRSHFGFSAGLSSLSTLIGFTLSLLVSKLPTVPTIVIVMIVIGLGLLPFQAPTRGKRIR